MGDMIFAGRYARQIEERNREEQRRTRLREIDRRYPNADHSVTRRLPKLRLNSRYNLSAFKFIIFVDENAYFYVLLCRDVESAIRAQCELKLLMKAFITYNNIAAFNVVPHDAWAANYRNLVHDFYYLLGQDRLRDTDLRELKIITEGIDSHQWIQTVCAVASVVLAIAAL